MRSKAYIKRMKNNPRKKKPPNLNDPKGPAQTPPRHDRSWAAWMETPTGLKALRRSLLHDLSSAPELKFKKRRGAVRQTAGPRPKAEA